MKIRKKYTSEFEAKVMIAAMKEDRTMSELSSEYGVHPIQIGLWKKIALRNLPKDFERDGAGQAKEREQQFLIEKLYG